MRPVELINKKVVIIDYYKSSNMPVHAFYQHDNNQLEFVIEENGTAADLSNVSRVLVNIKRPDGKVVSRELDRDENVILYKMQHEEMKVSGHAVLTLQFYNEDGDRLSTAKITIYIASTVEANVEFKDKQGTLYQQIIMEMDGLKDQLYTLNRLTEEKGETAESKGKFAEEKAQEAIDAAELAAEEAANLSQLKTDVTGATEAASTAAEAAQTNADHAKTQGDYAKEQADIAAQRTEELNGLEVSQFYDRQEEFSRQLAEMAKEKLDESVINKDIGLRNWDVQFPRSTTVSSALPKPCVLIVGDSITASSGADNYESGYANLLKNSLQLATGLTGKGYRGYYEFVNKNGWTKRTAEKGTNKMVWEIAPGASTITFNELCNKVDIIYSTQPDGGEFTVRFDNATNTVINSNGSESYHNVITREMPINEGFHTVEVMPPSSGKGYIEGLIFYGQDKGVIVHQLGHPGIKAVSYLNDSVSIKATISDFSPSLTILALGTNDCAQQQSLTQYKTALEQMASAAKITGDVVLLSMPMMTGGNSKTIPYRDYVETAKQVAKQNGYVHINMYEKWNKSDTFTSKYGLYTDGIHPTQGGHNAIAETIRNVIGGYPFSGFAKIVNSRLKLSLGSLLPSDIKIGNKGYDVTVTQGASALTVPLSDVLGYGTLPYSVAVSPNWNTSYWVTNKGYTGFTINFGTPAPSNAKIDWIVLRN